MNELPSRYNPKESEDRWYEVWEKNNYFHAKVNPAKKPFSIVIPPPNVTGILHMGHALNNTIQDILIRYHRMQQNESLWMPGTDHAGIATQNVVEKALAKDGLRRQDLGRDKFIERVWQWREQYGTTIIKQLKKIGSSCDWSRMRFTMDSEYSRAVLEVFIKLYQKGLIYRGTYIINWCPRCQTALADEEAPHQELKASLYYLKYPFQDNPADFIIVATTRPETMLGDTAVAVNPKDKRYKKLVGKILVLPLMNRQIKIIADTGVDMKFGTGAVKVTPAHDPNDYALGKKHKLDFINVLHPDGRMNEQAGRYQGLDRFEAREQILEDLKTLGLLEKIEEHALSAGHCYRCHTIIEPYLSRQWFVRMKPLAGPAIKAVKSGQVKFHPSRWTKVYLNWMENIQDWCISRQIWWGHRLPVYYCVDCQEKNSEKGVIVSYEKPKSCPDCGSTGIQQDEDVLDTWFSSWLWPFATFYWPDEKSKKDLEYFYPTSALVTAPEIIFFWVARMIMAGMEFMKEVPFKDVYIHGTVRDIEGKKMSKSLGNIIDPLDIINEYGADALRFSLISITAQGQDVFLTKERFEQGRNFANKIWNASRFILMNLDSAGAKTDLCQFFKKENLDIADRWILSRFYSVLKQTDKSLSAFRFNEAVNILYSFFWHEFCDWYLEIIKTEIKKYQHQVVMYKVLEKTLRLLHPFMPFVTEEIWQRLPGEGDSIMLGAWPHLESTMIDKKTEKVMQGLFELITTIRNMFAELENFTQINLAGAARNVNIFTENESQKKFLLSMAPTVESLSKTKILISPDKYCPAKSQYVAVLADMHIVIPLTDIIDSGLFSQRIEGELNKLERDIKTKENMLHNKDFLSRAPGEIVEKEKLKLTELDEKLKKLKAVKDGFQ